MGKILFDGEEAPKAAEEWLKANPRRARAWLAGVTTFDGQPGLDAVKKSLGSDHDAAGTAAACGPPPGPDVQRAGAVAWKSGSPGTRCRSARS